MSGFSGFSGFSAALAAALALFAVAAAVDLAAGVRWPRLVPVPYLLGTAGSACAAVAGAGHWPAGPCGWDRQPGVSSAPVPPGFPPTGCPDCSC